MHPLVHTQPRNSFRAPRSPADLRPALSSLLERLHVLVIGPGLGREDYMQNFAKLALNIAKEQVRTSAYISYHINLPTCAI